MVKQLAAHVTDLLLHLGPRLRTCGYMLPLPTCLRGVHGDKSTVLRYHRACHMFCLSQHPGFNYGGN